MNIGDKSKFLAAALRGLLITILIVGGLEVACGQSSQDEVFRAGVNGVSAPQCIHCPPPKYSDKARKAKYEGTVLLDAVVTKDGLITNVVTVKTPGMGLEERALAAVKHWKMRPAFGPNGKPVNCRVQIEVTFHLKN